MNFFTTFNRGKTVREYATILLKLKLTFIILITAILQAGASSFAQITLNEKGAPLEQVIQKIRKQSGFDFFYSSSLLNNAKPVTLHVENASVEEALKACLVNQAISYTIAQNTIILQPLNNRPITTSLAIIVSGRVLDENGNPLSGASVKIKGSKTAAIATGKDGDFRISADSENDIVLITFLGYEPYEVKASANPLTIRLKPMANQMKELTITTGIFKKVDQSFTGASSTITAKELSNFSNRNIITALRNMDPSFNVVESNAFGSNPNRLPEIQIRGNSSLPNVTELQDQTRVGLNTPLIILDGFQSTLQKLLDMNENEVESITLLKDAAATAIYGSRGSNGVVVITTKAPMAGKLRLNFRSDVSFEMADLSDYHLLHAREKLELEKRAGYYDNPRAEMDLPLKRYYNFLLNDVNRGVETDWMAIPLNTAIGQRYNLRLEGGDQTFRYSASAQLNNQPGVMIGSNRKTFNGGITLSYTYKNVLFRNNLQISQGHSKESPYGSFSSFAALNPYWRPYDDKGNVLKFLGDPGNTDYSNFWATLPTNPLYNATLNTFDKSASSEIINNTSVEWTPVKSLILRAQLGLTKNTSQSDVFRPAEHTAFANYSTADFFRKGDYRYGIGNGNSYDASVNLAYSRTFNLKHVLFAGVDYNMRENKSSNYSFLAEGFPNAKFDFISMALQYAKDGKPSGSEALTRSVGLTANTNYTYDNRYFVDGSLRIDGSSQFGINKRMAPFWAVGLGWNMHNEKFLRDNKIVNRLKIRGSAGITGSQNFNAYQSLSTYQYYTNDRYFNWLGAYLLGLGNDDLQWQQTMKYNIGTDAEFLNRRLKLTADYYVETTNDLVSSISLPASNGFTSYIENVGKLQNKGYEVKLTGFLIAKPGFTWSVTGAIMHNRNKIVETSTAYEKAQSQNKNSATVVDGIYVKGYSTNTIWAVRSLGIDPSTGKELYLGVDGLPTYTWKASDVVALGSKDPKIAGNFSTYVNYKNFSVNASFGYRFGGEQYNQTLVNKVEGGSYRYNVDQRVYDSRWQYPGDVAAFKGLLITGATNKTSRFIQDENTLQLQNISLQYDFRDTKLMESWKLQGLSVAANMADVFYLSSIKRERGTAYPFSKQFSLTLNVTF